MGPKRLLRRVIEEEWIEEGGPTEDSDDEADSDADEEDDGDDVEGKGGRLSGRARR